MVEQSTFNRLVMSSSLILRAPPPHTHITPMITAIFLLLNLYPSYLLTLHSTHSPSYTLPIIPLTLLTDLSFFLYLYSYTPHTTNLFLFDDLFHFDPLRCLVACLFLTLATLPWIISNLSVPSDSPLFILTNIFGLLLLIFSSNLLPFLTAFELTSFSTILLISTSRNTTITIRYFFLSGLFSIIFILGILLIYLDTGSINLHTIALLAHYDSTSPLLILASLFFFSTLFFKLAASPFHFYAIHIYPKLPRLISLYFLTAYKFV